MESTIINGRYRVVRELGRGGMGCVYLVEDTHCEDRLLALKTLLPKATSAAFLERFRVEFAELTKLRHANLSSAHDFGRIAETGEHFFTSEYIQGVNLFAATVRSSIAQLLDAMAQLLRGLDFIHSHGLLHNDLKPQNILVESLASSDEHAAGDSLRRLEAAVYGRVGRVKIIDFGLLSREGVAWKHVLGTLRYVSPERIRCKAADRRSDLYSLGAVLYAICARHPPFDAADRGTLLKMHLEAPVPDLAGARPDLPAPVHQLIHRLLQKRPEDRFSTAGTALRFLGEGLGWEAAPEVRSGAPEIVAGSLIGRGAEKAFLEERYRSIAAGTADSPCVLVEGPAGSGKTRLVDELRGIVQVSGGVFVDIRGAGLEGHLLPVLDAVRKALQTSGVKGMEDIRRHLSSGEELPGSSVDFALLLERFIFLHAGETPLLIHFDGFERASPTVRRFAVELAHSACQKLSRPEPRHRLVVIISRRCEGRAGDLGLGGVTRIQLEPFQEAEAREFVCRIFGEVDVPESVLAQLLRTGQGNPAFLLELVRDLVEKGHLKHNGARWVFPPSLGRLQLPESLSGLLQKRIASLDEKSRDILEWLSLCGTPLALPILSRCARLETEMLRFLLERMEKRGLLAAMEEEGKEQACPAYALANQGICKWIADRLKEEERAFRHQRLAQALEEEHGAEAAGTALASSDGPCELLAEHWLAAGNVPGFLRYAPAAAASLQKCGNFELAAEYHRRMIDAIPEEAASKKLKSLARLSELHEFLWDLDRSRADIEAMLTLGEGLLKPSDRVALLRRLATLEMACHRYEPALRLIEEARRLAGPQVDPLTMLTLDAPQAWAARFVGDEAGSSAALKRAESILEGLKPSEPRQKALAVGAANHLANLHFQLGGLQRAEALFQKNLDLLSDLKMPQAEASTRCSLGSVLLAAGNAAEASRHLHQAYAAAKSLGDRRTLCRAKERLGDCHLQSGDLKSALQTTQVGLQDAELSGNSSAMANSLRTLGLIYERSGDNDAAVRALENALHLYRTSGDPLGEPFARLLLARFHLKAGRIQEAMEHLQPSLEAAKRMGLALADGLGRLLMAEEVLVRTRRLDRANIESAEELFRTCGYAGEVVEARLLIARGLLETGSPAAAGEALAGSFQAALLTAGSQEQRARAKRLQSSIDQALGREAASNTSTQEFSRGSGARR